jgi:hypothetical protein
MGLGSIGFFADDMCLEITEIEIFKKRLLKGICVQVELVSNLVDYKTYPMIFRKRLDNKTSFVQRDIYTIKSTSFVLQ